MKGDASQQTRHRVISVAWQPADFHPGSPMRSPLRDLEYLGSEHAPLWHTSLSLRQTRKAWGNEILLLTSGFTQESRCCLQPRAPWGSRAALPSPAAPSPSASLLGVLKTLRCAGLQKRGRTKRRASSMQTALRKEELWFSFQGVSSS